MDLDDRLRNWGRWARSGIKLKACGSAEGRYRSNWRQWIALADISHPEPCDIFDAEAVEAAWVRMADHRQKKLLKLKYVWRLKDSGYMDESGHRVLGLCERLRIKLHQLEVESGRAHFHIRKQLDSQMNIRYGSRKIGMLPETVEACDALKGGVARPKETEAREVSGFFI